MARTEFELAHKLKPVKPSDFKDADGIRNYLIEILHNFLHKNERGVNASHYLETKFNELKEDYFKLIKTAEDTEMVFKSTYNFNL